ncbi:MAG: sugar ABC transporter permease [Lachnospiraceae bacterium]|jgi:multiple sugar transport system permease protein|nr:sugar ABC transporter permease [Lachnospiraceae bacterium]RKJ51609.1 sugar ABC transporter permease [bacterium 1XD42-54]
MDRKKKFIKFVTLESPDSWKLLYYPGRIILLLITIIPTVYALYLSLHYYNLGKLRDKKFIFLQNYIELFQDERFWNSLKVTLCFALISLAAELILGMLIALGLSKKIKLKGVAQTAILLPMIITPVVVALFWKMFYDPQFGNLSYFLSLLNLPVPDMLSYRNTALPAMIIVDIWEWTPYVALILLSGLQALPQEPYEAARVDGASRWQTFRYITFPLMRSAVNIAVIFRFMDLFKWMDTVYVMTGGGPGVSTETLSYYAYMNNFKFLDVGYASALCIVMLLIVMVICNTFGKKILLREPEGE